MKKSSGIHSVFMLRPKNFGFNSDTKNSNPWQNKVEFDQNYISEKAVSEFDDMVEKLSLHEIDVHVLEDSATLKLPDAVFLNNWIAVMSDKRSFVFPLAHHSRRGERRLEVIEDLSRLLDIEEVADLSYFENDNVFLESTGSIVFDYANKIAYASISDRTNEKLFNEFCKKVDFKGFVFNSVDLKGHPIYHTNVVLSIAEKYAIVCLDCLENNLERAFIKKMLEKSGKEIIEISIHQMLNFSGNSLEVFNKVGESKIVMSRTGYSAMKKDQIDAIEKYSEFVIVNVSIIEIVGGGSARCMMMGVPSYLNG